MSNCISVVTGTQISRDTRVSTGSARAATRQIVWTIYLRAKPLWVSTEYAGFISWGSRAGLMSQKYWRTTNPRRLHIFETLVLLVPFFPIFLRTFPTQNRVGSGQNRPKFKNPENSDKIQFFDALTTFIAPELVAPAQIKKKLIFYSNHFQRTFNRKTVRKP